VVRLSIAAYFLIVALPAGALTLAENGKATASIVLCEAPTPAEQTAAKELAAYLGAATGGTFAITPESQALALTGSIFVGDAAFASPEIYTFLEEEDYLYAIRLPGNQNLQHAIEHLLTRPVGRPSEAPKVFYERFTYQAKSWDQARRVVAKVEWHEGELFPRMGFIVTNLTQGAEGVVKFYSGRGTAEQWIKEGKNAVKWTRLSCHDFEDNQVRLQLFALAYNLGNFFRRLVLPQRVIHWSLTTLREKLIKIGAKVVTHARHITFQMAEVAIPRRLFKVILHRIRRLGPLMSAPT
jgi:hypothetical protein